MSDTDGRTTAPVGVKGRREAWLNGYEAEACPWCGALKVVRSREVRVCDNCGTVQVVTARYVPAGR